MNGTRLYKLSYMSKHFIKTDFTRSGKKRFIFIDRLCYPGLIQKVDCQIQEHSRTFLGGNTIFQEHFRRVIRPFYLQYYQPLRLVKQVGHISW